MGKIAVLATAIAMIMLPVMVSAEITMDQAAQAIQSSNQSIIEMGLDGFPTSRVADLLMEARLQFEAQSALEETGGTPDFSLVTRKTEEIGTIARKAYRIKDELKALELMIEETEGINRSGIYSMLGEATQEFDDERYDQASEIIESAYERISEEEALATKVNFFFENAQKNVYSFVSANWLALVIVSAVLAISLVISYSQISRFRIRRKIRKLELKKGVLNGMIKKLQKEYFEIKSISSSTYELKMKKYRELMRDIDRMKPLLLEDLQKKSGSV